MLAEVDSALGAEVTVLSLRPRPLLIQCHQLANGHADALHRLRVYCPHTLTPLMSYNGLTPPNPSDLLLPPHRWIPEDVTPNALLDVTFKAASNGYNAPQGGSEPPRPSESLSPFAEELLTPREMQVLRLATQRRDTE